MRISGIEEFCNLNVTSICTSTACSNSNHMVFVILVVLLNLIIDYLFFLLLLQTLEKRRFLNCYEFFAFENFFNALLLI